MNMKQWFLILICLVTIFLGITTPRVNAGGGGRAPITVVSQGVAGGKAAEIYATIQKDNDMKISVGEKGFFKIKDARLGQNCVTKNEVSDGQGRIYGSCTAPDDGEIKVYIHFPDKVEDAGPYAVNFVKKGQEPAQSTVSSGAQSSAQYPCNSGLTSYGWDPANGANCPQYEFDKWTAFCGNGYKEHISIGRCYPANDLGNDPEWKKRAEEICKNPACGTPAKPKPTTATTVATPKPAVATKSATVPVASAAAVIPTPVPQPPAPSIPPAEIEQPLELSWWQKSTQMVENFFENLRRILSGEAS
jgi:hypothetical protein